MKNKMLVLSILTSGIITGPSLAAQAQAGCCSGMRAMPSCSTMSGHESQDAKPTAVENLPKPVTTVFDNYALIQTALAQDAVQDVAKEAQAIAKAVNDDAMTTFSTNIVQQAQAVAKATDLRSVREAFKPLSKSLIEYVSNHPALAASYRQVHCSMANADWLQKESMVNNPYLGKEMLRCGEFIKNNSDGGQGHQGHSMPGMDM
jgi:hypothetical protein